MKILALPTFGYSPETRAYAGAVVLFTMPSKDSTTRTSNAGLEFNYTRNRQSIFEGDWAYFSNKERYFSQGKIHLSNYFDIFYGTNTFQPDTKITQYTNKRISGTANLLKRIKKHTFFGPSIRYINYYKLRADRKPVPKLLNEDQTMGLGATLLYDSRLSILTPTNGRYALVSTDFNKSSQSYLRFSADLRAYKNFKGFIWSHKLFINYQTKGAPFYDMSTAGGDEFVRGFRYGKFRSFSLNTYQTELRKTVYKRLGFAVFGGVSQLGNPSYIGLLFNGGMGMRFLLDKKEMTNLRLDYAWGTQKNNGFYVSFGEAF